MALVCVAPVKNRVKGPPLSETKISKKAMPEPPGSSLPDQRTVKVRGDTAGNGSTRLVGAPASIVLTMDGVSMGALVSKKTRPWASRRVPVGALFFARTV